MTYCLTLLNCRCWLLLSFIPHVDRYPRLISGASFIYVKKLRCSNQVAQLLVTIVAGIKLWRLVGNMLTHLAQIGPAVFAGGILHSVSQKINQGCVLVEITSVFLSPRTGWFIFAEYLGIDKLVAGADKRFRRLFFTKAIDYQARLANPRGQACKVAVARDDAEAIELLRIQQIHRINDQRAVGGIFPDGISELLNRLDCLLQKNVLPSPQIRSGPIAVDAPDTGNTVLGNLRE